MFRNQLLQDDQEGDQETKVAINWDVEIIVPDDQIEEDYRDRRDQVGDTTDKANEFD
jgi:hypothetical protein